MDELREADVTLEICPTSNLLTKALSGEGRGCRDVFRTFLDHGVPFTIAAEGTRDDATPCGTSSSCCSVSAVSEDEARAANARGQHGVVRGPARRRRYVTPRRPRVRMATAGLGAA